MADGDEDAVDVLARTLFASKGYTDPSEWQSELNLTTISENCYALLTSSNSSSMMNASNCLDYEISAALDQFMTADAEYYFLIYVAIAPILILLALVFNIIAIVVVSRCRDKYPRHHCLMSLSVSDQLLTMSLFVKRCADLNPSNTEFLHNNAAIPLQIGYIMSGLGLLCLGVDNVLAIAAPFYYQTLSRPLTTRLLLLSLWSAATTFAIVIRLLGLQNNMFIQIAFCVGMLVLLAGVTCSYSIACAQSHLAGRRLASLALPNNNGRRGSLGTTAKQLKGFLTLGILVLSCILCWAPLVSFLLIDEETLTSHYRFFNRYQAIAVLVLHLLAVVDPIIYCLRLRDIRKSLFKTLGIRRPTKQQSASSTTANHHHSAAHHHNRHHHNHHLSSASAPGGLTKQSPLLAS